MENKYFSIGIGIITFLILTNLILVYNSITTKVVVKKLETGKNDLEQEVKTLGASYGKLSNDFTALVNHVNGTSNNSQ